LRRQLVLEVRRRSDVEVGELRGEQAKSFELVVAVLEIVRPPALVAPAED
jgi:hypothetical protein